jgi:hypothetical protein
MTTANAPRPPASLAFDGSTRDYMRDPVTGFYLSRHWVDSAAFFWLFVEQGSVRSAPGIGQTITKIRYIDNTTTQQVQDRVLSAWSGLLSRGVIQVVSIDVDLSIRGTILYQANYKNLVLGRDGVTPQRAFSP